MEWFEIIKWIVGVLMAGGTGFGWLLFFRLKRRQLANKVSVDDYTDMQVIVDNYMAKSAEWIQIIDTLRDQLYEAKNVIAQLESEIAALRIKIDNDDS